MEVRLIEESDFDSVINWGKQWDSSYKRELFPLTGLIVPDVCAYFLYGTDSQVAFAENLISNKDASKEDRDKACTLIIEEMFKLAKDKGYTVLYACTNNPSVIIRAVQAGVSVTPNYALMQKKL